MLVVKGVGEGVAFTCRARGRRPRARRVCRPSARRAVVRAAVGRCTGGRGAPSLSNYCACARWAAWSRLDSWRGVRRRGVEARTPFSLPPASRPPLHYQDRVPLELGRRDARGTAEGRGRKKVGTASGSAAPAGRARPAPARRPLQARVGSSPAIDRLGQRLDALEQHGHARRDAPELDHVQDAAHGVGGRGGEEGTGEEKREKGQFQYLHCSISKVVTPATCRRCKFYRASVIFWNLYCQQAAAVRRPFSE